MLCPSCGAKNDDNAKFCLSCGGALNQAIPPQAPQTPINPVPAYQAPTPPAKKGHAGLIAVIVILFVLVIAGAGVFFVLSNKDDNKNDKETTVQTTVADQGTQNSTTKAQAEATTIAGQPSQQEIFDILNGSGLDAWDGNWNNLTTEQRQAIESYYAALGQGIFFGENGFTFEEDGETVQLGGQWPDSPLLKDVPKPAFGSIFSSTVADDEVDVIYSGWTPEQLLTYVGMVKAAGFTKNAEEMNVMGMSSYDADNGSVSITVGNAMGFFTITVETIQ